MSEQEKNKDSQAQSSKGSSGEASKQSSEEKKFNEAMKKSLQEMENDVYVDPSAATVVYPAEIGYSSHAIHKGPSSSPQIVEQARYERERNADPDAANKRFARDVLGLDVEVDDEPEEPERVYGGEYNTDEKYNLSDK